MKHLRFFFVPFCQTKVNSRVYIRACQRHFNYVCLITFSSSSFGFSSSLLHLECRVSRGEKNFISIWYSEDEYYMMFKTFFHVTKLGWKTCQKNKENIFISLIKFRIFHMGRKWKKMVNEEIISTFYFYHYFFVLIIIVKILLKFEGKGFKGWNFVEIEFTRFLNDYKSLFSARIACYNCV